MRKLLKRTLWFWLVFGLLLFLLTAENGYAQAHGGDQRVAENKYVVSLSRAPFTPHVGQKAELTFSFLELATWKSLHEPLTATVRIARLGDVRADRQHYIFQQRDIHTSDGGFTLDFAFPEEGLHEIFVEFSRDADPGRVYAPQDFMVDVDPPAPAAVIQSNTSGIVIVAVGLLACLAFWWSVRANGGIMNIGVGVRRPMSRRTLWTLLAIFAAAYLAVHYVVFDRYLPYGGLWNFIEEGRGHVWHVVPLLAIFGYFFALEGINRWKKRNRK